MKWPSVIKHGKNLALEEDLKTSQRKWWKKILIIEESQEKKLEFCLADKREKLSIFKPR